MKKIVVAAMSGGVDSSVAALYCRELGYEVIGATLKLKHPDPEFSAMQKCAADDDGRAVEAVCEKLGIRHIFLDAFADFEREILYPSYEEYAHGKTPNPCTFCNAKIKFAKLIAYADSIGAEFVATGHYARLKTLPDGSVQVFRGSDPVKDQTYFLYRLTREQLQRVRFPIGELEKSRVRELARQAGLVTADRKDSQDACFQAENECFPETLRRLVGAEPQRGRIVANGKIVGKHEGIHRYTLGQRKGLGVALGVPAYVSRIDPERNIIELSTDERVLGCKTFRVLDPVFTQGALPVKEFQASVQVRYRSKAVPCTVMPLADGTLQVSLYHELRAVTPGQAAVFYDGDLLLGGGIIDRESSPLC